VRLRQGRAQTEIVYGDDPVAVARRWVDEGAEWLHVVNLDGAFGESTAEDPRGQGGQAPDDLPLNLQRLRDIGRAVPATPIQFGGGVRSLNDVDTVLALGATRVVLGTVAAKDPGLVREVVARFGAERIVVGMDAREGKIATHGWLQTSELTAVALGLAMREIGVRRAVYTDIARDGMLTGVNLEGTVALARETGLKIIASGGVASLEELRHLHEHESDGIEGAIVGQALYTGALSLPEAIDAAAGARGEDREKGRSAHAG
jgi:phosphoribosylformimino-5-aminoimidazole carboxamide ribotide isomerase